MRTVALVNGAGQGTCHGLGDLCFSRYRGGAHDEDDVLGWLAHGL
jgi:hypothetical protein